MKSHRGAPHLRTFAYLAFGLCLALTACGEDQTTSDAQNPADAPPDSHSAPLLTDVLAGAHRSEKNRARDQSRHPIETLSFFGLEPDMTAVGVRATCPDCHVPKTWIHKIARKIKASNELYHHFLGTIDTPEKFEKKRLELATNVWKVMKSTDSRECRNCHNFDYMDFTTQEKRAQARHETAITDGKTCIDCHKGIAHELPEGAFEAEQKLN